MNTQRKAEAEVIKSRKMLFTLMEVRAVLSTVDRVIELYGEGSKEMTLGEIQSGLLGYIESDDEGVSK